MEQQRAIPTPGGKSGDTPTCGIAQGTMVLTLDGPLPVETLAPGDRIVTRAGAGRLTSIQVTQLAQARMVRIAPDVLGLGRPEGEVLVAADQPLLIRDWRAQVLYGAAQALVPAARLADGQYIRVEQMTDIRIFTLHLQGAAVIYVGGLELACEAEPVVA